MNKFEKLNYLLSSEENEYYKNDYFLEVELQIAALSESDISSLLAAWQSQNIEWWKRFTQSATHIQQSVLRHFLINAITTRHKTKAILSLMSRLSPEASSSELSQALVSYASKLWRSEPNLHLQIQMSIWPSGLSGKLLQTLGFSSWRDAGL